LAGLVALQYGLAASKWLIPLAAAALIIATYALYRRRHGRAPGGDTGSMGMGDGSD
jgi:hypothetical protein